MHRRAARSRPSASQRAAGFTDAANADENEGSPAAKSPSDVAIMARLVSSTNASARPSTAAERTCRERSVEPMVGLRGEAGRALGDASELHGLGKAAQAIEYVRADSCLLYTSPSPRD